MPSLTIAVDFDGTLAAHEYPDIGPEVPDAFVWLKRFQEAGAELILWTMRSDTGRYGPTLQQAIDFCRARGLTFIAANVNPTQHTWTSSPKCYAQLYIDDAALGCPLRPDPRGQQYRPVVDWAEVGPRVMALIQGRKDRDTTRKPGVTS